MKTMYCNLRMNVLGLQIELQGDEIIVFSLEIFLKNKQEDIWVETEEQKDKKKI